MGVIKDIVDIVVPRAQRRIAREGVDIKEALNREFKEMGYIQSSGKVVRKPQSDSEYVDSMN